MLSCSGVVLFSIQTLIVEGRLGGVGPTMNRSRVRTCLGPPDDWMATKRGTRDGSRSPTWRYGNFEIHFDRNDAVAMLFTDYLEDPDAGPERELDPWVLDPGTVLDPEQLREIIEAEGMAVERREDAVGRPVLVVESGAELVFDRDAPDGPWRWTAIEVRTGGPASRRTNAI